MREMPEATSAKHTLLTAAAQSMGVGVLVMERMLRGALWRMTMSLPRVTERKVVHPAMRVQSPGRSRAAAPAARAAMSRTTRVPQHA